MGVHGRAREVRREGADRWKQGKMDTGRAFKQETGKGEKEQTKVEGQKMRHGEEEKVETTKG